VAAATAAVAAAAAAAAAKERAVGGVEARPKEHEITTE